MTDDPPPPRISASSASAPRRRRDRVRDVFASVARYDVMNDLMSLGVHRLWKATLLDWIAPREDLQLLDVAGGTGDMAFGWRRRGGGGVTVCDINPEMLSVGRGRLEKRGMEMRHRLGRR